MDIKNCTAIISGGASGMGAATARLFAAAGAKVAIFDINRRGAEAVAKEIQGKAFDCNLVDAQSVERAVQEVNETLGTARICVNCAGIVRGERMVGKSGPMSLAAFNEVIQINLVGTFNLMRLAAASMVSLPVVNDSLERGVIINTASIAAFEGQIGQVAYSASKGGVVSMTLPAARELGRFGVRVVAIAPGLVETPMMADISEKVRAALVEKIPFPRRLANPEEFARLVEHIVENAMLNGEVIRLDGGTRM